MRQTCGPASAWRATVQEPHHGVVARLTQDADSHVLHVELAPWLWLLSRSSDCRVFTDKKLDEILTTHVIAGGRVALYLPENPR